MADAHPVTDGHTLVLPRRHVASIYDLIVTERDAVWDLVTLVREYLVGLLNADGFTIGINDGGADGQTIFHASVHVIPRRRRDVDDPRGGIRWVIPSKVRYWEE